MTLITDPSPSLIDRALSVTARFDPTERNNQILSLGREIGLNIDDINPFQSPRAVAMTMVHSAGCINCRDCGAMLEKLEEVLTRRESANRY